MPRSGSKERLIHYRHPLSYALFWMPKIHVYGIPTKCKSASLSISNLQGYSKILFRSSTNGLESIPLNLFAALICNENQQRKLVAQKMRPTTITILLFKNSSRLDRTLSCLPLIIITPLWGRSSYCRKTRLGVVLRKDSFILDSCTGWGMISPMV